MARKYSNNEFDFKIFDVKFIGAFLIVLTFASIILWGIFCREGSYDTERAMLRHKDKILVETLAKLPKGAFVHRVVDLELKKVCYLNAAGGGIQCFDIDELKVTDEEIIEKLKKHSNEYRRPYTYNSDYNSRNN